MVMFWRMLDYKKEPVADIFYANPFEINDGKLISLIYYFTGYGKGITSLKGRVLKVKEELVKDGYSLPDIKL